MACTGAALHSEPLSAESSPTQATQSRATEREPFLQVKAMAICADLQSLLQANTDTCFLTINHLRLHKMSRMPAWSPTVPCHNRTYSAGPKAARLPMQASARPGFSQSSTAGSPHLMRTGPAAAWSAAYPGTSPLAGRMDNSLLAAPGRPLSWTLPQSSQLSLHEQCGEQTQAAPLSAYRAALLASMQQRQQHTAALPSQHSRKAHSTAHCQLSGGRMRAAPLPACCPALSGTWAQQQMPW